MSTTIQYGFKPSFSSPPPLTSETWSLPPDDVRIPSGRHTVEEIRQMYPDWDTKEPAPFEELFGCVESTPEEAEAFIQSIAENRQENQHLVAEREERERLFQ